MMQDDCPTVLVVDDEPLIRMMAAEIFEDLGCEVLEARDGIEALSVINDRPDIDLLFSDCRMPRMEGPELAEAAARLRPDLRIVLATGYVGTVPQGWPVLWKPYRPGDLARLMDRPAEAA